jgi:hypothetical protein
MVMPNCTLMQGNSAGQGDIPTIGRFDPTNVPTNFPTNIPDRIRLSLSLTTGILRTILFQQTKTTTSIPRKSD